MLSYFIIKAEWFDVDAFVRAAREHDPNGVIVVYNYGGEFKVAQCPPSIPLKPVYHFYKRGTWTENPWVKWPTHIVVAVWILLQVLRRERINVFYCEGGDIISWVAQIFKKFGRIRRTIFMMADWAIPEIHHGFHNRINKVKIKLNDRLLTAMDTTVIVTPKEIFDLRNDYWQGKTLKNSVLYDNHWAWLLEQKRPTPMGPPGKTICYLGNLRKHFCVEMLFDLLPELNQSHGFRLKIIGPETALYREYKKLSEETGVAQFIDWRGFVPLETFNEELAGSFCGVNLQENDVNDSRHVVAGRIVNFLQYMLVPVVTPASGAAVKYIEQYGLGVICSPHREALKSAILEAYENSPKYLKCIEKLLRENPYKREFGDILQF